MEHNKNKREYAFLSTILLVAILFSFYPHLNYPYPLHRDEWDRITLANAVIHEKSTVFPDPFLGERVFDSHLEIGFILLLAEIKLTSGLSWESIFRYFPVLISALITLSVYILARRLGYGLHAAFFASLIPTSVRLLGPAFFVPVSLALTFLPLSIYLLLFYKSAKGRAVFSIFLCFLLYEHPPTGVALLLISAIYIIKEKEPKIIPWILAAVILSIPQFLPFIESKGEEVLIFKTFVHFSDLFTEYGLLPSLLFVVGSFLLLKKNERDVIFVYSAAVLLILNFLYRRLEWTFLIMPERNYLYLMLLMSLPAGFALAKVKNPGLSVLLILATFILAFQNLISTPFYHIIDEREYDDFLWIKENLEGRALIDPWKAIAFTALAEKPVYSTISLGPNPKAEERNRAIARFFENACNDTEFLRKNNISIVYSYVNCKNPDLEKIKDRIYVLR